MRVVGGGWRLARDERSEAAADEEAAHDEAGGVGDEHDADDEGARQEEAESQPLACAHDVAHGAHDEAREDGAGHRHDICQIEIILAEAVGHVLRDLLDVRRLRRGGGGGARRGGPCLIHSSSGEGLWCTEANQQVGL